MLRSSSAGSGVQPEARLQGPQERAPAGLGTPLAQLAEPPTPNQAQRAASTRARSSTVFERSGERQREPAQGRTDRRGDSDRELDRERIRRPCEEATESPSQLDR